MRAINIGRQICLAIEAAWMLAAAGALCAADDAKTSPPDAADAFRVPDGTPDELLKYLDGLRKLRPATVSYQGMVEHNKQMGRAFVEAADKILAAKPTKEQTAKALEYKLNGLATLDQWGDAKAGKQLKPLLEQIEAAGLPQLARRAQGFLLAGRLRKIRGPEQANELKRLFADVKAYLAAGPIQRADLQLLEGFASIAERSGSLDFAQQVYRDFVKILAASHDKSAAAFAARLQGALRRTSLKDTPMIVEGTTLDGKPFDFSAYAGKVVLVDFWATWCGPCRAELPNVQRDYTAYHDRGFEVVGISLDRSKGDLEKFLKKEKLPWTIILDGAGPKAKGAAANAEPAAAKAGQPRSMANYYGVSGIPTAILLGKDGKAISLNARGETLTKALEKVFGPAHGDKSKTTGNPAVETRPSSRRTVPAG